MIGRNKEKNEYFYKLIMKKLVLKGGLVCDPLKKIHRICDVLIIDNKITEISKTTKNEWSDEFNVLDLRGMIVLPGLIDFHTHLRDPVLSGKRIYIVGL